jgi:6-aminohexanoate-oligomer endohydrolase
VHPRASLLAVQVALLCLHPVWAGAQSPGTGATSGALTPRTTFHGPALQVDFPAIHIGIAEYDEGPTGATVFYFPDGVMAAVDVRGGAPGTTATDFLRLGYETPFVDAIAFAGGSSYGLSAATGVAQEIRALRAEYGGEWGGIATVPGAIIFDLGPRRFNTVVPDEALGRAALRAAEPGRFPLGPRGAGRFATQGSWFGRGFEYRQHSGQGAAFRQIGPTKIAVFTVVNALGTVVDRDGNVVRCANDPAAPPCGPVARYLTDALERKTRADRSAAAHLNGAHGEAPSRNTTLTLVVTNQRLSFWALQRLAIQVHTSMARGIQPFHTDRDGDVLFAVTTGEVENRRLAPVDLGAVASEVAWDAILASVPELPAVAPETEAVDPTLYDAYAGTYAFGTGATLTVTRDGDRLMVEATGERPVYSFAPGAPWQLIPTSATEFVSRNPRADRLRFVREGDRVVAIVLNPGPWEILAPRSAR